MKLSKTQRRVLTELSQPRAYLTFVAERGLWSQNGWDDYVINRTVSELQRLGFVKHRRGADIATLVITPTGRAALAGSEGKP